MLSVDGEASIVDYQEKIADDISLLLAAGPELTFEGGVAAFQATLFRREYGGFLANEGFGVRGRYQRLLDEDERVTLYLDARIFESGYGEAYEGEQASAYLVYEVVFDPDFSGNITLYGRREWLGFDPFSNFEFGSYGGLNAYLNEQIAAASRSGSPACCSTIRSRPCRPAPGETGACSAASTSRRAARHSSASRPR
jgi:hypothetical protein